ncbi:MAG: hypothetical protein ACKV0T_25960 [Planctomycetales bacterium]
MSISFSCDNCHSQFTVDSQLAGRSARCRKCGRKTQIPSDSSPGRPLVNWQQAGAGPALRGSTAVGGGGGARAQGAAGIGTANGGPPGRAERWLEAVNSQIGLKPVTMPSIAAIRQRPRDEPEDDPRTSYKVVLPRELRQKNRITSRPAGMIKVGYLQGLRSYKNFWGNLAALFRWINETAYGLSIPFLILAIVGAIMNKHSLTVLGISVIVLLNIARLGSGLFNLAVIPFRDNPIKGVLFLFPPVTAYYMWTNRYRWRKPIRRVLSPLATLAVVIAAYVYIPWLNGNQEARGKLEDRIGSAVRGIRQGISESTTEVGKKASELKDKAAEQLNQESIDKAKAQGSQLLEGLQEATNKLSGSEESAPAADNSIPPPAPPRGGRRGKK